ncbi:hypothetical protein, partial [Alloalcanivorax venustensis]|uniref:hypothetical protein n=1 Tax=Alloalcanivorax venustensis TaxID=172371 RepID=UPI003C5B3E18
ERSLGPSLATSAALPWMVIPALLPTYSTCTSRHRAAPNGWILDVEGKWRPPPRCNGTIDVAVQEAVIPIVHHEL